MDEKMKRCPYCGKEIKEVARKCRYYGMWIDGDDDRMVTCPSCGERVDKRSRKCPYCCEPLPIKANDGDARPLSEPPSTDTKSAQDLVAPADNGGQGASPDGGKAEHQGTEENVQRKDTPAEGMPGGGERGILPFGSALQRCFRKYAVFEGRALRAEFWWFVLFCGIVYTLTYVGVLAMLAHDGDVTGVYILASIISGLLLIPYCLNFRLICSDNVG